MATSSDKIDFSRISYEVRKHKWYFIASFVIVMGIAILYMLKKNPEFKIHADVLVEQPQSATGSGGFAKLMQTFSMGHIGAGSVEDEILVVESRSLLADAVKSLGLNYQHTEKSGMRKKSLYRKSPVDIASTIDLDTLQKGATFQVKLHADGKADIKVKGKFFSTLYEKNGAALPIDVKLPIGTFRISKTQFFKPGKERDVEVELQGTPRLCEKIAKILSVDLISHKANGISFTYVDEDKQRGKDLLAKIIELYNVRRLREERDKTETEIAFIDNRIATLMMQMSDSEKKLEDYKTANDLTDIAAEAEVLLKQTSLNKSSIVELQTQLSVLDMICEFLEDPANKYSMIPVSSGVNNESAAKSIASYNDLILERMKLDVSAKSDNQALKTLNKQIDGMRQGVVLTMQKARESARIAYDDFVREGGTYASRLRQLPSHERQYVDLYREAEIQNNLYIFLLQQRESNSLKFSTKAIVRIIDPPYNDVKKVWPRGSIVLGLALLLSLLLPYAAGAVTSLRLRRIAVPADIARLSVIPVVSTMPENAEEEQRALRRLRDHLLSESKAATVAVTSPTVNIESSAFAASLAQSFTATGRRVALVDFSADRTAAHRLGASIQTSLTDCFSGNASIDSAQAEAIDGIQVVASGSAADLDMISSTEFDTLLDRFKQYNDIVIINGDDFDKYSALKAVAHRVDRIMAYVPSGCESRHLKALDRELASLPVACGYVLQEK